MSTEPLVDDDLLDDLMNIVQHNDTADNSHSNNSATGLNENSQTSGNEALGGTGTEPGDDEFDEVECGDDDENSIDELLEKPIDILDDKKDEQVNFYTYDKIQIKSKHTFFRFSA